MIWRTWAGVALISFSAVLVRLADVEPARSAFLRNLYALPVLAALVWLHRRRGGTGPRAGLLPVAVAAGLLLGLDLAAWHVSIAIIGAGLATVLPNLQVVFVGFVALVVFRERPHPAFWACLPLVLGGVWMLAVAGEAITPGGSVLAGVAFGVASGVFYAAYLVVLRVARVRRPEASVYDVMLSATLGAAIATAVVAGVQGVAAPAGAWPADGWLVLLALSSQVAGWLLLASSIHLLPVSLTSVALLLQPLLALVWARLLLGEPIGIPQVAGALVLLAGVAGAHHAVVRGQRRVVALRDETLR